MANEDTATHVDEADMWRFRIIDGELWEIKSRPPTEADKSWYLPLPDLGSTEAPPSMADPVKDKE